MFESTQRLAVLLRARRSRIRRPAATTKGSEPAAAEHLLRGETEACTTRVSRNGLLGGERSGSRDSGTVSGFQLAVPLIRNDMGLHSDFFVMRDDELATVLPGWEWEAPRLDKPIERVGINPFTGAPLAIKTWVNPDQPQVSKSAAKSPVLQGRAVVSRKWITSHELDELYSVMLGESVDEIRNSPGYPGLLGPEDRYGGVELVRFDVTETLATATTKQIGQWAEAWVAVRGEEDYPSWSAGDFEELLVELATLAKDAVRTGGRLYLHYGEP